MSNTAFITREQLRNRIGETALKRLLANGSAADADVDAVDQLIFDACTWVRSHLGFTFSFADLDADQAANLVRIALDMAHGYGAQRRPEVLRVNPDTFFKRASADIKEVRLGKQNDGSPAPKEPRSETHRGIVYDGGQRVMLDGPNGSNSGDF